MDNIAASFAYNATPHYFRRSSGRRGSWAHQPAHFRRSLSRACQRRALGTTVRCGALYGGVRPHSGRSSIRARPSSTELEDISIVSREPLVDGLSLARYSARVALTGSPVPAITIMEGPGEPAPLAAPDLLDLAFLVASFGRVPTAADHSEGSRYLALRAAIEQRLDLRHIHLGVRGGERQVELENAVEKVAMRLAEHSLAFSQSAELAFGTFVELINKGRRIFTFSAGADTLLGTTAQPRCRIR